MKRGIFTYLVFIFIGLQGQAQTNIPALESVSKDSLDYYVKQQIKRLEAHPEYHVDSMMQAGLIVYNRGEVAYARQFFELAYQRHKQNGDIMQMARSNANIAVIYELEGKYDQALERHFKSLKLIDSIKDSISDYEFSVIQGKILNNIGTLYNEINQFDNAQPYFLQSIKADNKIIKICQDSIQIPRYQKQLNNSKEGIAISYNNIAFSWENKTKKNLDSALYYYKKALAILEGTKSPQEYHIRSNIGVIYAQKKDFAKAQSILEQCYKEAKQNKAENSFSSVFHSLAYVYTETGQYPKAHEVIDKGIEDAQKNKILKDEVELVALLFELQSKEGNYQLANKTSKNLITLKDSLLNQEKNEAVAKQEVLYETEKKTYEAKIAKEQLLIKETKLKNQQSWFLIVSLFVLLLASFAVFFVWRNRIKEKHRKIMLKNKLFRSQMNPHFMYNALAAIQSYMLEHKNKESIHYLLGFSNLMRNILDSSRVENISIDKEKAIINDYLMLQKLRFDNKFDYTLHLDPKIDAENTFIPSMLAQPFVENAVEHGIKSLPETTQGRINIYFEKIEHGVRIRILDNGKGMNSEHKKTKTHTSHATSITNERITSINEITPYKVSLNIHSSENKGTEIVINVYHTTH